MCCSIPSHGSMWNMVQASPCWQLLLVHCCCTFLLPASVVLDSVTKALSDLSTSTLMKVRALLFLPGQHTSIHLSGEFTDTNFSSGRDASIWHDTQLMPTAKHNNPSQIMRNNTSNQSRSLARRAVPPFRQRKDNPCGTARRVPFGSKYLAESVDDTPRSSVHHFPYLSLVADNKMKAYQDNKMTCIRMDLPHEFKHWKFLFLVVNISDDGRCRNPLGSFLQSMYVPVLIKT